MEATKVAQTHLGGGGVRTSSTWFQSPRRKGDHLGLWNCHPYCPLFTHNLDVHNNIGIIHRVKGPYLNVAGNAVGQTIRLRR